MSFDNFFIYDLETLSTQADAVVLNIAMCGGSFEDYFTTTASYDAIRNMFKLIIKENDAMGYTIAEAHKEKFMKHVNQILDNLREGIRVHAFDAKAQAQAGFDIEESVMNFWKNNQEAYLSTYLDREKEDINDFPKIVHRYLKEIGYREDRSSEAHKVWIRAPHFDDPIVKNICRQVQGVGIVPYSHFNVRDIRTIVDAAFINNNGDGYANVFFEGGGNFFNSLELVAHDSKDDLCRDILMLYISLVRLDLV